MSNIPPLLPQEALARVVRLARLDGLSVLGVAGLFALLAGSVGDLRGALIGLAIAATGAGELHGVAVLRHGEARGINWLVGSQLALLAGMLSYCAFRLTYVDLEPLRLAFQTMLRSPAMQQMWEANQQAGMTEAKFLQQTHTLTYTSLALATLIYQGGMSLYYLRRRDAVTRALAEE